MKLLCPLVVLLGSLALDGCRSPGPSWVPLATGPTAPAEITLVWVGRGQCERFEDGRWVRRPEFDYEFTVEQRRRAGHWSSVKSLQRRHPAYDGSAGPRAQTYFFELELGSPDTSGRVAAQLTSSLGKGALRADREFRQAVMEIRADVSRFAPFDRYKITQSYLYEQGRLEELVELDDGDHPWVRNREQAALYGPQRFAAAP